jgi:hypothetical protein
MNPILFSCEAWLNLDDSDDSDGNGATDEVELIFCCCWLLLRSQFVLLAPNDNLTYSNTKE